MVTPSIKMSYINTYFSSYYFNTMAVLTTNELAQCQLFNPFLTLLVKLTTNYYGRLLDIINIVKTLFILVLFSVNILFPIFITSFKVWSRHCTTMHLILIAGIKTSTDNSGIEFCIFESTSGGHESLF